MARTRKNQTPPYSPPPIEVQVGQTLQETLRDLGYEFRRAEKEYTECVAEFAAKIVADPLYAIEWRASRVVLATTNWTYLRELRDEIDARFAAGTLNKYVLLDLIDACEKRTAYDVLRNSDGDGSTSAFTNATRRFQNEARAYLVRYTLRTLVAVVKGSMPEIQA